MMENADGIMNTSFGQRRVEIVQSKGSSHELDALFDAAALSKVKPLRERGLPPSFFQQPDQAMRGGSNAAHSRTVSLPVDLQESFSLAGSNQHINMPNFDGNPNEFSGVSSVSANQNAAHFTVTGGNFCAQQQFTSSQVMGTGRHARQTSLDVALQNTNANTNLNLNTSSCQVVPNSISSSTLSPNAQMSFERCKCVEQPFDVLSLDRLLPASRLYTAQGSPIISEELLTQTDFGRLLPRWQYELSAERQVYFVDHLCQRTTWCHPRIPLEQQRNVPFVVVSKQVYATMLGEFERRQREQQQTAANVGVSTAPPLPPRDRLRQAQLAADQHLALHPRRRQLGEQSICGAAAAAVGRQQLAQAATQNAVHSRARSECYGGWQVAVGAVGAVSDQIDFSTVSGSGGEFGALNASEMAGQSGVVHSRSASYPAHCVMDTGMGLSLATDMPPAIGVTKQQQQQQQQQQQSQNQQLVQSSWNGSGSGCMANSQVLPNVSTLTFGSMNSGMTLSQHSQLANSPSSLASSPAHQLTSSSSMEFHARQESDSGLSSVPHTMPHTPEESASMAGRDALSTKLAPFAGSSIDGNGSMAGVRYDYGAFDMGELSTADFGLLMLQDNAQPLCSNGAAMSWSAMS